MTRRANLGARRKGLWLFVLFLLLSPSWVAARSRSRVSVGFGVAFGVPIYHGYGGVYYPAYYPEDIYYNPPPRPIYAFVDTDIHPEEAEVYLDGKVIGIADDFDGFPGYLAIKPGRHTLQFRHDGYRSLSFNLRLRAGELVDLDRKLPKLSAGESDDLPAPPARRREAASDRSYPSDRRKESSEEDSEVLRVEQGFGVLRLKVLPVAAKVMIDGDFFGTGAEISRLHGGIPLRPGEHRIDVTLAGYRKQVVETKIEVDEESAVQIALKRQ
ncbi:MAG TPA: PEGA domain-containing protein [Candidatus Polarisedimenticolia bacterium]|nr:PEGA domain-containing protein [Candidatus Polarisedimenticolia bacterium]